MNGNELYWGDNLEVLQRHFKNRDDTVDLIYLDPPFNSDQDYNVLFKERDGKRSSAQIKAFTDTWRWDQTASAAFDASMVEGGNIARVLQAFRACVGDSDMLAYLAMMAPRLRELHRVL